MKSRAIYALRLIPMFPPSVGDDGDKSVDIISYDAMFRPYKSNL
ncbi:hypothetical protein HanRHA438_Chr07g0311701 [Helianthus annuus]|nr:hypothetical protein HanRHA438_Chr07g0311701 [Helianthus annuus]